MAAMLQSLFAGQTQLNFVGNIVSVLCHNIACFCDFKLVFWTGIVNMLTKLQNVNEQA